MLGVVTSIYNNYIHQNRYHFKHRHHLHRQQTLLHAHQKPGIKTPECNEPSPMNIHVLYLTIVILKLPVPHFT